VTIEQASEDCGAFALGRFTASSLIATNNAADGFAMFSRPLALRAGAFVAVASISLLSYAQAPATGVNWRTNVDAAMVEAAQSDRLVLLHFTTRTCGPCKALDQTVFNQPQVGAALEQDYVPVRIDADVAKALSARYRIERVPTEIIVTPDGNPIASPEIPNSPEPFVAQLQNFAQHFRQTRGANSKGTNAAYAGLQPGAMPAGATAGQEITPTPLGGAGQPLPPNRRQPARSWSSAERLWLLAAAAGDDAGQRDAGQLPLDGDGVGRGNARRCGPSARQEAGASRFAGRFAAALLRRLLPRDAQDAQSLDVWQPAVWRRPSRTHLSVRWPAAAGAVPGGSRFLQPRVRRQGPGPAA
jgi:thiol-disulfide isomerase/thioredoxin